MAKQTAIERREKRRERTDTQPGEIRNLDDFQKSFLTALEGIGEPKPPVKYIRPVIESFKGKDAKDSSILRFSLFLDPKLNLNVNYSINQQRKKDGLPPINVTDLLESKDEKDYISGWDEIRKGIVAGSHDLVLGVGTILFGGTDLATNTDFLGKFNEFMKDKEPTQPETWRGDLIALLTQFGVPGGLIQKVVNRTKTAGRLKKTIEGIKGSKKKKLSTIAYRAIEGMTVVGATDFIASEPGRESFFFEPESTEGLTGRKKAAAEFKNKIKYGAEGSTIGFGFPLVGKGLQIGYKYGLAPFVKTSASLGAKGINNTVFRPITYLGGSSRLSLKDVSKRLPDVGVVNPVGKYATPFLAKKVRQATNFALTKAIAPAIVSAFSGKIVRQLPPFEKWRLFSINKDAYLGESRDLKIGRGIKRLDNILSYFRSFGKAPKDIEGVSEKIMLFIKGRARKLDRTMEGLEKKAYNLAKGFENNYNKATSSPALQKHYLDQVEQFLRDQIKKQDLPKELQALSGDLKQEVKNVMKEFQKSLPKGKEGDKITKTLENIEFNRINNYLIKSFSTFTNPNYAPDQKVYGTAVDWVSKNIIKKNKDLRLRAESDFSKFKIEDAYKESAKMMVDSILLAGKAEGRNPLRALKEIGKLIRFKDYQFLKTGEELPNAVKSLLGEEKNLKAVVGSTTAEMISAMANKRAADFIADSGLKNKWLFNSVEEAINNGVLNAQQINKMPRLGTHMKSKLTQLYADPEYAQMFQGVGGKLDNLLTMPIYREIMQGKVAVQIGKTLYSPQTQVRNVSSAAFFALMNGHIGGNASVTNAIKIVLDDIFKAGQKNIDEVEFNNYVERLVRLGVWDENVVASELKAIMDAVKNNSIKSSDELFDKLIKMTPTDKVARVYAGGDNLWKHFGFEFERSLLGQGFRNIGDIKTYFREMGEEFVDVNPITGAIKSFDDALDEAAAYSIRNTYPTYSKVPPFIQNLRKIPLGTFVSFPAEILRTGANIVNFGLKQASSSNAAVRQMGLRRLLGGFMTLYAGGTGIVQTAQFLTNSTSAQWDAYKRSSAAPWDKNSSLLPIKEWKDGESAAVNYSYFSPYDSLYAPMAAALAKAQTQKLNPQQTRDYVLELMFAEDGPLITLLNPFITEPLGYDRLLDVTTRNGRKQGGGTVYSDSDSAGDAIAKSIAYIIDGVKPGIFVNVDKVSGAISKDLTKGGKPLNLKDELLALLAGTRVIRIDVKKDLRYFTSDMNRKLRATDDNENFYNVDNYQNNTPSDMVRTYEKMQEEAFRIQKDMFIRIQDLKLLDLDEDTIEEIMIKSGASKKLVNALMDGEFTPVNYSKKRFETKVNTLEEEVENFTNNKFKYSLNEEFVFPEDELDDVFDEYEDKEFFTRGSEYEPEKFDYKLDKKGNILKDENGDPVKDEGFVKKVLRKGTEVVRDLVTPDNEVKIQTPPLPNTPMPVVKTATLPGANTNLTRTQQALLSPAEQIIASRRT